MKVMRRFLTGVRDPNQLEKAILNSLSADVALSQRDTLKAQISASRTVKPMFSGRVVALNFDASRQAVPLFKNADVDRIAWAGRATDSLGRSIRFFVTVIRGEIDAITYVTKPESHGSAREWSVESISTTDLSYSERYSNRLSLGELTNEPLKQDLLALGATTWFPPVSLERREAMIQLVGGALPKEFVDFVSKCDGFLSNGWEFYGVSGRSLDWPDGSSFLIICEDESSLAALALLFDSDKGEFVLLDQEHADFEFCGTNLESAIDQFLVSYKEKSTCDLN